MSYEESRTYLYQGKNYTLSELAELSQIHHETLRHRLEYGMSVEEAIALAHGRIPHPKPEDIGKQVPIVFQCPVPSVHEHMQPTLGKQYIATLHGKRTKTNQLCKVFYTITLENGKSLITYPGEFTPLGTAI